MKTALSRRDPTVATRTGLTSSCGWHANDEFNKLYDQVNTETDIDKATQIWKQLNDIVINNYITLPLVDRKSGDGKVKAIQGPDLSPFEPWSRNIADWTKS